MTLSAAVLAVSLAWQVGALLRAVPEDAPSGSGAGTGEPLLEEGQSDGGLDLASRPWRRRHHGSGATAAAAVSEPQAESGNSSSKNVVQMQNYGDVQYVTYLTMGKQTITGIIDTGSFDLVIFSRVCGSCGLAGKYDPWKSDRYKSGKLMTVQSYGSGDTYSTEASDYLGLGFFEERNQSFWEVVTAKMPVLKNAAFQSIVGVGPPETPAADAWESAEAAYKNVTQYFKNSSKPPMSLMKQVQEGLDAAIEVSKAPTMLDNFDIQTFSMCLGKETGSDGYITWKDTTHEEQPELFTRVQILGTHTWSVALANVRLQGGTGHRGDMAVGCEGGCSALMDSGTSLLAVPRSVMDTFEEAIQHLHVDCGNLHELPDLTFELGGKKFYLPADAYVAEVTGGLPEYLQSFVRLRSLKVGNNGTGEVARCHILLMESFADSANGPLWILGMPFFRRYYTSFHVGRSHDERALYIAHAGANCKPVHADYAEKGPRRRRIDPSKLHVPRSVVKAAQRGFVNL